MLNQPGASGGGYGYKKVKPWQWVVIYLIIGTIVYGAIYYFYVSQRGGYTTTNNVAAPASQYYRY
ncbi:MAG: hypothetical protein A2951_01705 [Candidatus Buchananbacteria bacterium RIFCSPLOWO2_01_FULL_56_15]|uniref:Uncharacterized protein n=1 Tax=Candidatus Buchananbacteria bacterium RIFCSPLOWO2_01_FULL_56_15 TaxID=1797547 RepID=A0A1G1YR07_9BACT|nr:MAG: hypothetical protein A2951_01705 [Candidatus Buchananbacteria bacterium RIFCSPLOWO2_01_FULL_56_15]